MVKFRSWPPVSLPPKGARLLYPPDLRCFGWRTKHRGVFFVSLQQRAIYSVNVPVLHSIPDTFWAGVEYDRLLLL